MVLYERANLLMRGTHSNRRSMWTVEAVHSTEASARLLHCGPLLLMPEDQQRLAGLQGLALVRVCTFTCSTGSCICDTWNGVPSA
jgi:hypothetical protein